MEPLGSSGAGTNRAAEHGVCGTGESDDPPGDSSVSTTDVGDSTGSAIAAGTSRMVAGLLPLCATACVIAGAAGATDRAGWEAWPAAVSATDAGDGSRADQSRLDRAGTALAPAASNTQCCLSGWKRRQMIPSSLARRSDRAQEQNRGSSECWTPRRRPESRSKADQRIIHHRQMEHHVSAFWGSAHKRWVNCRSWEQQGADRDRAPAR